MKESILNLPFYEPDTGFLFSEHFLYTKKLSDISPDEIKTLDFLSQDYQQKLKFESSKISNTDDFEVVLDEAFNKQNRKILRLNQEIKD